MKNYSECKKCKLLNKIFKSINNNYEYWLMTELFVYLHNGKDYCEKAFKKNKNTKTA